MGKKNPIRTLIENGVKLRHRSLFVIFGDESREQIVELHSTMVKSKTSVLNSVKSKTRVLWCYKNKLDISRHSDSLSSFLDKEEVTHCFYKDSEQILGNTFGMCILHDFEALTPNLFAQTIETVEGGGLIILLLPSLASLNSLCTMVMDVHDTFRTESRSEATGRFNKRFLLSLAYCKSCVVTDDKLKILPLSSHISSIGRVPVAGKDSEELSEAEQDLKKAKDDLDGFSHARSFVEKCCTLDQRKAVLALLEAVLDKTPRGIVALIASRGRGKSAALGLAVAAAVAVGYPNIYITAPSPDNLKTLFKFVGRGFIALKYKNYEIVRSVNPDSKDAIERINIFQNRRQTIQYIQPHEHEKLSHVDLLVIDEAAAIPLPVVESLLGPYLVLLSSTNSGYEGTGRSLSLKLLDQLEQRDSSSFKKIELKESIRYAAGDPVEDWLSGLLCLDGASSLPDPACFPLPSECNLYYVDRDTLFSYDQENELVLQRMMALRVSSHYKNSPNDLQILADAPGQLLFVLLGSVDEYKKTLPDILCVLEVCLEGQISKELVMESLKDGRLPHGDQIPWKFFEQFQDFAFPTLSGARIVNIAVHPNATERGYESVAVERLTRYFEGEQASISEGNVEASSVRVTEAAKTVSLLEEQIEPRVNLSRLLVPLCDRRPEKLDYLGVSFGLTLDLFSFWREQKFAPFYISQIPSAVTGEHTCMVLKLLNSDSPFYQDFRTRFSKLLSVTYKKMDYKLAMSVLEPKISFPQIEPSVKKLDGVISRRDMQRLEAYVENRVDFNVVYDLYITLAHQYFQEELPVSLSKTRAAALFCAGLQELDFADIQRQMQLEKGQIHSLLLDVAIEFYTYLNKKRGSGVESSTSKKKKKTERKKI